MDQTTLIINRVLPILLLIALGSGLRRGRLLSENTVDELQKIVVYFALPAVLFTSFLNITLESRYLVLFVIVFALCVGLLVIGGVLRRVLHIDHPYFPFLITGFEYGLLGVSLFGSAYGLENVGYIAVVDLGHETFIWFVFLALLLMRRDGLTRPAEFAVSIVRSPVIIAIVSGIALNLLGAREFLTNSAITGGILNTMQFLSSITVPLILIIVGYSIRIDRQNLRDAALTVGLRMLIIIPLVIVLNAVVINGLLGLDVPFQAALFTLLILPPPFIVPLYMPSSMSDERQYVNTVLTLSTVVTIVLFVVYFIANPVL